MGQKILRVSNELLVEMFRLDQRGDDTRYWIEGMPADASIVGVSDQIYFDRNAIAFKVESAEFPEVRAGEAIPELNLLTGQVIPERPKRGMEYL